MTAFIERREFIMLLGGAALAGALPAAAQKGTALIGLLGSGSAHSSGIFVDSLKEGLSDGGLREGRDYVLDLRWAEGNYERFPALARELVERKADVILATTISAVRAARRATAAIPIVMTSITNAVGAGLQPLKGLLRQDILILFRCRTYHANSHEAVAFETVMWLPVRLRRRRGEFHM